MTKALRLGRVPGDGVTLETKRGDLAAALVVLEWSRA